MKKQSMKIRKRGVCALAAAMLAFAAPAARADTATVIHNTGDEVTVAGNFGHIDHECGTQDDYTGTVLITNTSGGHFAPDATVTLATHNAVSSYSVTGSGTVPSSWADGDTFEFAMTITVHDTYLHGNLNLKATGAKQDGGEWSDGFLVKVHCTNETGPDTTAPDITCDAPDDTVWYDNNQTVHCVASDSQSGLADPNDGDPGFDLVTTVASGNQTSTASTGTHQVCDLAVPANCVTAGPYTFKVDRKKPTLSPSVTPNPAVLNSTPAADPGASDGTDGSGLASSSCDTPDTSTVGPHTVACTATDNVGNTDTANASYSVVYGDCGGTGLAVLQPVNDTRKGNPPSEFKQGSTVPVKFRACDANNVSIGTAGLVKSIKLVSKNPTSAAGTIGSTPPSTAPYTTFRFDPVGQQWIFNLSTSKYSKSATYGFLITLNDDSTIPFQLLVK